MGTENKRTSSAFGLNTDSETALGRRVGQGRFDRWPTTFDVVP